MDIIVKTSKMIGKHLQSIPKIWEGKNAILEMKNANYSHWKQMEWIEFYFQFLCEKFLCPIMQIPGPKYGTVMFDGFNKVPWDFKAHAINTSIHQIIVNDSQAIANGIKDYSAVSLILALGNVVYNDEKRTFQKWHEELKGGLSKYSMNRIKRGVWSRLRKVSFDLQQISFIKITDETLKKCRAFQRDFRNTDGSPRQEKVLLDLEEINDELIHSIEF